MRKKLLLLASVLCLAMGCGGELSADDSEVSNGVSETVDNEKSGDDFFKDDEEREKPKATATPTPEPLDENVITIEGKGFMPMEYVSTMYKEGELVNVIVGEGIENIYFGGCKSLEKVKLPSSMTYIGMETFCNCESLVKVGIPETVTAIYEYAFSGCTSLETIELPKSITQISVEAFSGCAKLKEITIPNGVSSIGQGCFKDCWSLKEITIPEGVTSIGYETFAGCIGLEEVTIPSSVTYIDENAFVGCNELKFNYEVGSYAEQWLVSTGRLKAYTIDGNTITFHAISDTFTGSFVIEALEKSIYNNGGVIIIFEEGIKHIADKAFDAYYTIYFDSYGPDAIKKIILPNSLETIGNYAFHYCYLEEITIPASVTYIGDRAFSSVDNFIYEPDSYAEWWLMENEYIDGNPQRKCTIEGDTLTFHAVFDYPVMYPDYDTDEYNKVTNIIVENGIKYIPSFTLLMNPFVTNIVLPDSVVSIEDGLTFGKLDQNNSLKNIILPNNLERIGDIVFLSYTALEDITFPDSLKYIGKRAFYGCTSLKEVTIPASVII